MELVDGTQPGEPTVVLAAPTPQVWTKVGSVDVPKVGGGSIAAQCLAAAREHTPGGRVVTRVGIAGASVTFQTKESSLVACDSSAGRPEGDARWCGRAHGRFDGGHLDDPRLDLAGCTTAGGDPVAFAWFEPAEDTAYVAVRQNGYVEVYPTGSGLPIRIATTSGIDIGRSSATFDLSEHDRLGAIVRTSQLVARVAG